MADFPYRLFFRQGDFELDVEGDRNFVESYVATFLKVEKPAAKTVRPAKRAPAARKAQARKKAAAVGKKPAKVPFTVDAAGLKAYMKGRTMATSKDRYLAYAGFLRSAGMRSFSDGAIQACFKADGAKIPRTGRQNFSLFQKQGLMKRSGKRGMWNLTSKGMDALSGKAQAKPEAKAKAKRKAKKPGIAKKKAGGRKK